MGAKNSRLLSSNGNHVEGEGSSSGQRPTPLIEAPYGGPWAEYQFIDATVPVDGDVSFNFAEVPMTSTRSASALTSLEGLYAQGYSLVTFCRVPGGSQHKKPFTPGKDLKYQGIFCRYEGDPGNEGWRLRVEKSLLHVQHVTPGVVGGTETGPGAQHVTQLISNTVQTGGRLLTVQWSGLAQHSGSETALGVDVIFEVPDEPIPERSVYMLVTAPANVVRRSLFASKGHVACDWAGILTRHLARGWRLVDVFCEVPAQSASTALSPAHTKIQTVWFFEKPEARARDDTAVYEGTIVEHWIDVSSGVSRTGSCLGGGGGGGGGGDRRGGRGGGASSSGKRTSGKSSLKKKSEDAAKNDETKQGSSKGTENADTGHSRNKDDKGSENKGKHHVKFPPTPQSDPGTAGWEGVLRSMGEKGWELACVINTQDTQAVGGRPRVKVLLIFQRRLSLAHCVQGRRTSDGLSLRADTGASTSVVCDIPLLAGETASHLNPSLAVRLPLSRSASRDGGADYTHLADDDIPSTIGGPCSRTNSALELSDSAHGSDAAHLEPRLSGSGYSGGGGGGLLRPKGSIGEEGSVGIQSGRSTPSSSHSKVTAEVHSSGETGSITPTNESKECIALGQKPCESSRFSGEVCESQTSPQKGEDSHKSPQKGENSQECEKGNSKNPGQNGDSQNPQHSDQNMTSENPTKTPGSQNHDGDSQNNNSPTEKAGLTDSGDAGAQKNSEKVENHQSATAVKNCAAESSDSTPQDQSVAQEVGS